jgi:signal transduction histidine kinase/CheY-like chemotaxis protein
LSIINLPLTLVQSLLDQSSDLFFIFSQEGQCIYTNATQSNHYVLSSINIRSFFKDHAIEGTDWSNLFDYCKEKESIITQAQYPFHTHQETLVTLKLFSHQIDHNNYLVIQILDSSAMHQCEKLEEDHFSLNQRLQNITEANEYLTSISEAKDNFLASMSHELRTPLNSILGLSEALLESVYGQLNIEQIQSIRYIETSGKHLLALISDILDISKIRAGGLTLTVNKVDVKSVCSEVIQSFKSEMKRKQLSFSFSVEGNVYNLNADERWFKQMLMNLLSNAVKFTPTGNKIGLTVKGDIPNKILRVSVWDHGIGIKACDHHMIFQSFVQLDTSLARVYQGTGLGLSIVESVMKLHGGSIDFESEYNVGSTFHLNFPWEPVSSLTQAKFTPPSLNLNLVLLVEDSEIDAQKIQRYLNEMNIQVHWDNTGTNTIQYAEDLQPELILLDLYLPQISGWDLLNQLKINPKTAKIPVIVCSVLDPHDSKLKTETIIYDYLVKPLSRRDLRRSLRMYTDIELHKDESHVEVNANSSSLNVLKKVLIVDDNLSNIQLLQDYLKRKGYQILTAEDGYQAIQVTRALQPDLILMDIQMPHMDGIEATGHIKTDPQLKETPIFALTALAMPGDRERCLDAGMDDYFTKPVRLRMLYKKIKATLGC